MDYTTQKGDTLSKIALNNNTTVSELSKLNNIQNPNLIQTGQVIKIPSKVESVNNTANIDPTQNIQNPIANNPIAVSSLNNPTPSISIPTPQPQPQVLPSTNLAQQIIDSTQVNETATQKTARELSQKLSDLIPSTVGESQALSEAQKVQGIPDLNKSLTDVNNQIIMKQAELAKDDMSLAQGLQNIEDKPIAMEFITGQQSSVQRNAQIARGIKNAEIGILNARAAALTNNISLARQLAQDAVDAKYAPIKETINVYKLQLEALQPILSADEKKVAREQEIRTNLALQDVKNKQEDEKKIQDMIINASSQGAPYDLTLRASEAKTPMQAASILGQYSGDYWKIQSIKSQLATDSLQRAKLSSEISSATTKNTGQNTTNLLFSINKLLNNNNGLTSAVGPISSKLPTLSEDTSNFESDFKQLQSLLTLDNIKYLKGTGQISDKEQEILSKAATSLDLTMGQKYFKKTLKEMKDALILNNPQLSAYSNYTNSSDAIAGKIIEAKNNVDNNQKEQPLILFGK